MAITIRIAISLMKSRDESRKGVAVIIAESGFGWGAIIVMSDEINGGLNIAAQTDHRAKTSSSARPCPEIMPIDGRLTLSVRSMNQRANCLALQIWHALCNRAASVGNFDIFIIGLKKWPAPIGFNQPD